MRKCKKSVKKICYFRSTSMFGKKIKVTQEFYETSPEHVDKQPLTSEFFSI